MPNLTNLNTVNINISSLTSGVMNGGGNAPLTFSRGDIISAFVTEKRNGEATLTMQNGFSFKVDAGRITGELGEELRFSIEKFDRDGIVLRQLGLFTTGNQITTALNEQTIKELFDKSGFTKDIDIFDGDYLEEQARSAEAVARIRRQLSYAASNLSPNVIAELIAAGISLQNINIEMLTETIREIKANEPDGGYGFSAEEATQKLASISNLSDGAVLKLLKENAPLTIDNIYFAKHSAAELKTENKISQEAWKQLEADAAKLFEREGIETSAKTDQLWKMMVENDVPVTKENIQKAVFLLGLSDVNLVGIAADGKDLFEMFTSLESGMTPEKSLNIDANAKELTDILGKVTDKNVEYVINSGHDLNFANLKALFSGTEFVKSEYEPVDIVTAKLQMAELQLRMTEEAARRLYGKGLDIDTMPLRRVIEELKALEAERHSALLRAAGAPDTAENVSRLGRLYEAMRESRPFTNNVFAVAMAEGHTLDISAVHEAVMSARSMRALNDLATFQTAPDPKYKDSFAKVYSQVAPFVENLGLDATQQNVKAAAILSKNEMDVTVDNILSIKEIDTKLTDVYNRLHPSIAASLIKDGHNPLKMHIDDVAAYINEFNDEYGHNLADKIPEYIAQMDKDKTLTKDERDAMIAVYRMLNNIQKNGAAAIGVAVKNEIDMTLGNMLEASKSFKKTQGKTNNLEYAVDDNFQGVEAITDREGSIYGAIEKTESAKVENYHSMISRQFADNLDPRALKKLLAGENVMDMPFDELNALLADIKPEYSESARNEAMRHASESFNITSEAVKYMMTNNIPLTLANMGIIQKMLKNPNYIADSLDELKDSEIGGIISDSLPDSSLESAAAGEEEVLQNIANSLENAWDKSDNPETLTKIGMIQNGIKLQSFAPKANSLDFKIPINFGGKITGLNMYILNANADFNSETSVLISLKTANLGEVGIAVTIEGNDVKAAVIGENERSVNHLMHEKEKLEEFLSDVGFNLTELKFRLKGQGEISPTAANQALSSFLTESSKYEAVI